MDTLKEIIITLRNIGIGIAGVTFIILLIKMSIEPDEKSKYIKLTKHLLIATILITISFSLVDIPKMYFGSTVEIVDEGASDMTIEKVEDKDCQDREVVNLGGERYVVTDTGKKLAALTDDEPLHYAFGLYSEGKVVDNVSYLRLFNECQDFWKGYYADIQYYRDADGFIFPTTYTYSEYINAKSNQNNNIETGGNDNNEK